MIGNEEGYTSEMKAMRSRHVGTSIDKTLGARFLGRDSVLLDVRYYCCAYVVYVVHVVSMMLCACGVLYT